MIELLFLAFFSGKSTNDNLDFSESGFISELIYIHGNQRTPKFSTDHFVNYDLFQKPEHFLKKVRKKCQDEEKVFLAVFYNIPESSLERIILSLFYLHKYNKDQIHVNTIMIGNHAIEQKRTSIISKNDFKDSLEEFLPKFNSEFTTKYPGKTFLLIKQEKKIKHAIAFDFIIEFELFETCNFKTYGLNLATGKSVFDFSEHK